MTKHESRDTVLFARVKKRNYQWVVAEMKRLKFKSKSEYMDILLELAQEGQRKIRTRVHAPKNFKRPARTKKKK